MALDVDAVRVRGRWYRHGPPGWPALVARELPPDNRWQRGQVVDALYLARTRETVWAEWYRHLAEAGVPPSRAVPRSLWTWQVDVRVADLTDDARLARVGLAPLRPGRRSWPAYQAVGEALWAEGWHGLVTLSAARPGHRVLCLFRDADDISGARPEPPPEIVADPPVPPRGMTT